jgi:DNA-binding transcriptional LysR family regulator
VLLKNIDHQLRLFVEIARHKSLSAAAEALDANQPGLSRQLASLESSLGQALFERNGRGVELTEAGRKILEVARPAYELIDNAVLQLRDQQGVTEGSLKVATIHTLSYYFIADVMAKFMSQRPKVNVTLLGRSSPEVVELVESGKADIGFAYDTAVVTGGVDITPLFSEEMCLVVPEQSALASRNDVNLCEEKLALIVFPSHYALRRMLHTNDLDAKVAAEVETVDAMLKLTSLTGGQCVLPDRIPVQLLRDYQLARVKISYPPLGRRIVAIAKTGRAQSSLGLLMLEIARAIAV